MNKLIDTVDYINGKGILTVLTDNFDVPWEESTSIDKQSLDDDYYLNHSGDRPVSPLVAKFLNSDGELTDANSLRIAKVIYSKYIDNWNRVWLAIQEEYNPLHNYDGTETYSENTSDGYTKHNTGTVEDSGSDTGTQTNNVTNTGTVGISGSDTGTQTNLGTNTGTQRTDNGIYGFNSSNSSNDNNSVRTDNLANSNTRTDNLAHTETTTNNLTENATRTDNLAHANTRTDNLTETNEGEGTKEYTLEKGGNLGVTTSQQMLESEYEFRLKYNFFDSVVFPNIDNVMCMPYYTDKDLY